MMNKAPWRCRLFGHRWYRCRTESHRLVFTSRVCWRCHYAEVQNKLGEWIDFADAFTGPFGEWERRVFLESMANKNDWSATISLESTA